MGRKRCKTPPQQWQTPNEHEHYSLLFDSLIESDVWKKLSPQATKLYILIVSRYKGIYTGNVVTCTYSLCKEYGFRQQSLTKWFKELESAGLIEIESQGGLYKEPNKYRLSDKWWRDRLNHI